MKKYFFTAFVTLFVLLPISIEAQNPSKRKNDVKDNLTYTTPKLVVGIVVDQMRYDYLTRFYNRYGEGGFKRLMNEGFNCRNNHYNYVPTYTGPGHTSVYTGTTPEFHGIIANNWYDKNLDKSVYCAQDDAVSPVGTESDAGKMSPNRMLTTTITDQLRLATQMRGKVVGVSLKDRASILPAGHAANAAYWFHGGKEGVWITSTYYMKELPKWAADFNKSKAAEKYIKEWNTLYDINSYVESGNDKNDFEGKFNGEENAVFPHDIEKIWKQNGGFDILKAIPYGNSLTVDFALAALEGEQLGQDDITDFLAVSFSATDYVGHRFGVNSKEVEDTYLRLDKDLENFFKTLDKKVGKGNYTVFLTADHAAVEVPSYLQSVKIPGAYFDSGKMKASLNSFLLKEYNTDKLIKNISNLQIFLDHELIDGLDLDLEEVEKKMANEILGYNGIFEVYTGEDMKTQNYTQPVPYLLQKGYNHKRSGDLLMVMSPGTISYPKTGSTHGSPWNYDTYTPLLFYGKGIKKGSTVARTEITDIAPTIAALLGIAFPNGAIGNPIGEVLKD